MDGERHPSGAHMRRGPGKPASGSMVCHLDDLSHSSKTSLRALAERVDKDRRILALWADNKAKKFDLDLLARLCAIFGGIPVKVILDYRGPEERERAQAGPASIPQTRSISVVRALPALPADYGRIVFVLESWLEGAGWQAGQLADEVGVQKKTISELLRGETSSITWRTLLGLCERLGGIERVMRYTMEAPG